MHCLAEQAIFLLGLSHMGVARSRLFGCVLLCSRAQMGQCDSSFTQFGLWVDSGVCN